MLGKRILNRRAVTENVKNPVFIEAKAKYSAWGFGGTDFFHYYGYKRNQDFF